MELFYRITNSGIRVWKRNWQGDQFEIITEEEFEVLKGLWSRLSIAFTEVQDD